jgi:L-seryl-tRNA(Ser) seleniumtransferase
VRPSDATVTERLRHLPQMQRLLETEAAQALIRAHSRATATSALRAAIDAVRRGMLDGAAGPPDCEALVAQAAEALRQASRPALRRVLNATGIVLHTNLGRAPLSEAATRAVAEAARGYCNLEYDLDAGGRGGRGGGVEALLRELTGAEAALAVNNNAAAVLLALSALAGGGDVIVSRGELVEIGGGFRVPDVIRQGGARLVEVGTTNRTRLSDYRAAITPQTRVLLKVHPSNYRIVGFTEAPSVAELAGMAREAGLMLMEDLGSGALFDLRRLGRAGEPTVRDSVAAGADLVAFSGDKLLGGPQAGLLVGAERAIEVLRTHPLMRAMRADKLTLAALEATLLAYRDPETAPAALPVLRMLAQTEAKLEARALRLAAALRGLGHVEMVASTGYSGGGSLPGTGIASRAVSLSARGWSAAALARALRLHDPALVGRIAENRVLLDLLTLSDDEACEAADAVRAVLEGGPR